jgi:SAM-dependent methyltransferase
VAAVGGSSLTASNPLGGDDAAALFQNDWQTYRKFVDYNYMFHREAYGTLHAALLESHRQPFRFLDIACGDASASATALAGTSVAAYHGIDLSREALRLADQAIRPLGCPYRLEESDFTAALPASREGTDVAWIGLSLHHLRAEGKVLMMREIRRLVGPSGSLYIFENTSPDGETRDQWLARWDAERAAWTAFTVAEWERVRAHVHGNDFPETDATWRQLGAAAGFGSVEELYRTPTDLFRLYRFQ